MAAPDAREKEPPLKKFVLEAENELRIEVADEEFVSLSVGSGARVCATRLSGWMCLVAERDGRGCRHRARQGTRV
jgi:hypothetical protein